MQDILQNMTNNHKVKAGLTIFWIVLLLFLSILLVTGFIYICEISENSRYHGLISIGAVIMAAGIMGSSIHKAIIRIKQIW